MSSSTVTAGSAGHPAGPARPRPRQRRFDWRAVALIWGFAAPALIVYVTFVIVPVALAAVYSFFNWNGLGPLDRFIGFDNYVRAITDPTFLKAVGNNLAIVGLSLLIQGPIAIGVALLLNRRLRGRTLVRVLIFVPYVLSEVVAALAFKLILQPNGPFDSVLASVGLSGIKQLWLADQTVVFWTLFFVLSWKYLGFAILLMLAGLQGVPEELSEAASIDGASWWQTQRYVTLPLLGPTVRIWAFLSMIGSLQLFDMVWVLTGGGPVNATVTMATYMVQYGFQRSQLGFGSAVAVLLFVISLIFALIYQRFVLRRDLSGAVTGGRR
jgi:raffinose/stachyose/melibiose transport system permease protein